MMDLSWTLPPPRPMTALSNRVHVWKACLSSPDLLALGTKALSDNEKQRARSMGCNAQRNRFTAARTCLRNILSRYLEVKCPQDIQLSSSARGKPEIVCPTSDIRFNVTHTGNVGLFVVSNGVEVGIDIERCDRPVKNLQGLLISRLTENEHLSLLRGMSHQTGQEYSQALREEFLKMWTRKEAFVKCTGDGIRSFGQFEISESNGVYSIRDRFRDKCSSSFTLTDLLVDDDHFATVAMASENVKIDCLQWQLTFT